MGEKPFRQTNNKMDIHGEMLYEKLAVQWTESTIRADPHLSSNLKNLAMFLSIELILYASK